MASEWPTVRLGDHVDSSLGKMLDANKNKGTLAPYLGNSNVRWGQFDLDDLAQMKFESHEAERYGIRDGDLIVCEGGEPGRCAIWREQIPGMKIQKALHRVRAKPSLSNRYLFYWFMLAGRTGQLEPYFTGTTIKHLTGKALAELKVQLPPIAEQHAIAATLGALDDRIDNLRQTSATLQAIAAALFKSRFVDFDGAPPEDMQESELGLTPKGWRVEEIGKLVQCVGGATPSTKDETFWNGGIHHWATPKDLSGLQAPVLITTERRITDAGVARISSGLLPVGTLLMSSRAPIGYLAIAAIPVAINQGFIAMLPDGALSPVWLLFWAQANMEAIKQKANGSTFMEISKAAFRPIKVALPPPDALAQFDEVTAPMLERIQNNERHIATLAAIRDALLPRLLSGQLRVNQ